MCIPGVTPIEAARLGKDLERYPPFWGRRRAPRPGSGIVPPDPPAHDYADRCGRDFQLDLGLQGADREPADRLYPRNRAACGRDHAYAPDRRAGRPSPDPHRLSWCDRPVAGNDGGGAASRPRHPQFRHPGIYAPHAGDRRGIPACLQLCRWHAAPRRRAGPGGGDRRDAGRAFPPRPRLPAREPARRRNHVELVMRGGALFPRARPGERAGAATQAVAARYRSRATGARRG
ncbi:hypothetical protein DdX_22041 [Ditylenchus destructor]|uniref:Uncharacterized protein n=1 Tax=Ditylenchus destructor TaxID=166010 RepID=A0AAD4QV10_9BILA|nr:hypothetical protein DdX_22041 [Ditylenchus destructor]